jgi:outer membrane receptor protein involved in Fe transport
VNRYPILRGVRVTFNVTNLFNQSVNVRDTVGATPFIYEAAVLDPTGRMISINLRKVFY